ncbi:hypothetical protein FO519_007321 [Halicephalobus sp. NKZ332]|nr:hypothetical protein FO519_007321 [Halicephalobus sp. NKZ332]
MVFPHYYGRKSTNIDSLPTFFNDTRNNHYNSTAKLEKEIHENFESILVKDENSTKRLNHIISLGTIDPWNFDDTIEMSFISGKDFVYPVGFNYVTKKPNLIWIWILISVMILLVITLAGIAGVLYRKKRRGIMIQIRKVAEKSGMQKEDISLFEKAKKELFIDPKLVNINFDKILGKGSTATVYYGKIKGPAPVQTYFKSLETREFFDCKVAIKIGDDFTRDAVEQFLNEINAVKKIGFHKNICCLLGWTLHQGVPSMIMEPVNMNLLSLIKEFKNKNNDLDIKEMYKIFFQITSAMIKVSSLGLVHRDLATRNILLTPQLQVKLTDFGLCSICDETFTYRASLQNKLPIRWLSLEALTERLFSEASDVWSFGVLSWEVFSFGEVPYCSLENLELVDFLRSGNRLQKLENIPEEFWTLMESCWNEDRLQRPNFLKLNENMRSLIEKLTENYGYLSYEENLEQVL